MGTNVSKTQQAIHKAPLELVANSSERYHIFSNKLQQQPRGLVNFGSTCYFNATITALFGSEHFGQYITSKEWPMHDELAASLRSLFTEMRKRKTHAVFPQDSFSRLSTLRPEWTTSRQQDAHELLNFLLNHLHDTANPAGEESLEGQERLNSALFEGYLSHVTRCLACDSSSTTAEKYYDLCLDMAPTLEQALMKLSRMEYLKLSEKYYCDKCHQHQNAVRFCRLKEVPQVTVIQLKRFRYDPRTGFLSKIRDVCTFPIDLILTPSSNGFMSDPRNMPLPDVLLRLRRHWRVKGLGAVEGARDSGDGASPPSINGFERVPIGMLKEFSNTIYQEMRQHLSLFAVICHIGSSLSAGHYVCVVRRTESATHSVNWWLVDDEDVLPLTPEQMRNFCEGKPVHEKRLAETLKTENAYLLFYEPRI